jgi:hypothetical protein
MYVFFKMLYGTGTKQQVTFFALSAGFEIVLVYVQAVLGIRNRIWICRIRMFLGLPDPDPLVRGTGTDLAPNPDPSLFLISVLSGLQKCISNTVRTAIFYFIYCTK